MKKSKTNRGFGIYEFEDSYGNGCSIQKSSAGSEPHIWLGINDVEPKILAQNAIKLNVENFGQTTGWVPYPIPEDVLLNSRMHLTREQVAELIPILQKFVEVGEI